MDTLAESVMNALPEDALYVLFGDHGMTNSGDHGGSSEEETDSALFIYSKSPIDIGSTVSTATGEAGAGQSPRMTSQVDLVPTLSLLLGLPIPFSSLGSILPELFHCGGEEGPSRDCLEAHVSDSLVGVVVVVAVIL